VSAVLRRERAALLRWYRAHRRDLPWRRTRDPYAVWVSEIMLQQTRVATVIPYYEAFLERFPDVRALANAGEEQVLARWSGLGYYRRARSLHRAARVVVREHGGEVPDTFEGLLSLPGVGRYTAGAIASIAFGRETPVLDGNVRRVLARRFGIDGARLGGAAETRALWTRAREWVCGASPGDFNQALMELGATLCAPQEPACERCPLRRGCRARAEAAFDRYPAAAARARSHSVRVAVGLVVRAGKLLLERPAGDGPLRGTWDVPAVEVDGDAPAAEALERRLHARHGLTVAAGEIVGRATHGILQRRLKLEVLTGSLRAGAVAGRDALRWVRLDELDEVAVSGATIKAVALAQSQRASARAGRSATSSSSPSGGSSRRKRYGRARSNGQAPKATSNPAQ